MNQKVRLALVLAVLGLAGRGDATNVSGTIASNTTWTSAASPYVVTSTVTVNSAATLTIEAGATVKFNAGTQLVLNGKLTAIGTSNSPILFTSSSGSPTPGSWGNIFFNSGAVSGSQISYATISYGGSHGTDNGALVVVGGNPTFDNVTVSSSSSHGFNMGGSSATIQNCTSTGNAWYGLSVWYGTATITNSSFSGNADRGIGVFNTSTASLSNVTVSGNGGFAIWMDATAQLTSLSGVTATGNGGGSKNVIAVGAGSTPVGAAWHPGLTYQVQGANAVVTVPSGRTLTIDPGVTVQFPTGGQLSVFGNLQAVGTALSPMTFTSSAASPTPGSWGNIYFQSGSSAASRVSYATISYGGNSGFYGGLRVNGGAPTFDHVTVSSSGSHGFDLPGGSATITNCTSTGSAWDGLSVWQATATVSDTTLTANSGYGLNVLNSSSASLTNVTITNNGTYAIQMAASAKITTLSGVTATGNGGGSKNQIMVNAGTTPASVTWRAGLPYVMSAINTTITVPANGTMTIDPGVTILFTSGSQLSVGGKLLAVGTAGSPITFTSSSASPTPGSWRNIYFSSSTPGSQLSYATISYAGSSDYGAIVVNAGTPTFDHVTVTSSGNNGIYVTGGTATIQNSTVSGSAASGISVWNSAASAVVSSTTLSGNSGRGLNAANFASASLSNVTITNNGDFALGIDANGRLTSLSGVTATGNGGGSKDVIGVDTGSWMSIANQVWHAGLPYRLSSTNASLSINGAGVLTIDPGVVVQFPAGGQMIVNGRLVAVGTQASPITFTSSAIAPTPGSWRNIQIGGTSPGSQIAYATVAYGGASGYYAAVRIVGGAQALDHVTVSSSGAHGVEVYAGSAALTDCTLSGNVSDGMTISSGSATVSGSAVSANGGNGISLSNSSTVALSNVAFQGNGSFAVLMAPSAQVTSMSNITATGNGGGAKNQIGLLGGNVGTNVGWHAGLPYATSGSGVTIGISANATLTIDPGATVLFGPTTKLNISGRLLAVGTPGNRIAMTTSASTPAPGGWGGIVIAGGSSGSQIAYADVSYGGDPASGNQAMIVAYGPLVLDHATVSRSSRHGLELIGGAVTVLNSTVNANSWSGISAWTGQLTATDSAFRDNGHGGIWVQNSSSATVARCSFSGNAVGLEHVTASPQLTAKLNDWNSESGPAGLGPGTGQAIGQAASFEPWLVGAPDPAYQILTASTDFNPTSVTTTWTATATSSGTWQVVVKDSSGAVVRTLGATGVNATITWDGKNEAGTLQPDGAYTYTIGVTSSGGTPAVSARGVLHLVDMSILKVTAPSLEIDRSTITSLPLGSVLPFAGNQTIQIKQWVTPTQVATIRTLISNVPRASGGYTDYWDYKDDAGHLVKDDAYFLTSTLTDGTTTQTYDLTYNYFGDYEMLDPGVIYTGSFDPFLGKPVKFTVTYQRPGWRWIILMPGRDWAGTEDPSHCNYPNICLTQDEAQPSGPATIEWSGVDDSGQNRPDIGSVVTVQSRVDMGKNAVVLKGTRPAIANLQIAPRRLDPQTGSQSITFDLTTFQGEPAAVSVAFVSQTSHSTLRTISMASQAPGSVALAWDGRGDNGMLVAPGLYTATVVVLDARSNRVAVSTQLEVTYR